MTSLTSMQEKVLTGIGYLVEMNGYPPSVYELCVLLELQSTSTIAFHLGALKRKGFVTWEPGMKRTLRVMKEMPSKTPQ